MFLVSYAVMFVLFILALLHFVRAVTVHPANPERHETVTFSFTGPLTSETANPNPFLFYRFDLHLTHKHSPHSYKLPGYFAADGNAAESSATSGRIWRAHFTPPLTGTWNFKASFCSGENIAVTDGNGTKVGFDGESGSFTVSENAIQSSDLRTKGRLEYIGQRYLRFSNGEYFIKLGTNTPESLLAFEDFDGYDGPEEMKLRYVKHVQDFRKGDASWQGRGYGLIGAVNFLAKQGVNSLFAMLMTVKGDSKGAVHPWIRGDSRRYDVSKLGQWDIVFGHAERKGMVLNLVLCETENESLFEADEGGDETFATERKVYYREMIARFSHHLGVVWTLGEEIGWNEPASSGGGEKWGVGNTYEQQVKFIKYLKKLDPYKSAIGIHTYPTMKQRVYEAHLGKKELQSANLQLGHKASTYDQTAYWVDKSIKSGVPWVVTVDEFGSDGPNLPGGVPLDIGLSEDYRGDFVWANFLAGGGGVEVFSAPVDQKLDDFRRLHSAWKMFKRPKQLVDLGVPVWDLQRMPVLTDGGLAYAGGRRGDWYVVYKASHVRAALNLTGVTGEFVLRWFDPNGGEGLQMGNVQSLKGDGVVWLDGAPGERDWVAVVSRENVQKRWTSGVSSNLLVR